MLAVIIESILMWLEIWLHKYTDLCGPDSETYFIHFCNQVKYCDRKIKHWWFNQYGNNSIFITEPLNNINKGYMRAGNTMVLIQIIAHWLFWECNVVSFDMLFCLHFQITTIKFNFGATLTSSAQLKNCWTEAWQVCGTCSAGILSDRIELRQCFL